MVLYEYDGPVMSFDRVVASRWSGRTQAVSEKRARANLTYQYKKANGLLPSSRITLPGTVSEVERSYYARD